MEAAAESLLSCLTLCDPTDSSPPGSPIPGILQARTLEWVAISFSNAWKWKVKVKLLSHVQLLVTPGTAAYQAPLSMGFSRQEYCSGLPLPSLLKRLRQSNRNTFSFSAVCSMVLFNFTSLEFHLSPFLLSQKRIQKQTKQKRKPNKPNYSTVPR